jgi:hypothetical protein
VYSKARTAETGARETKELGGDTVPTARQYHHHKRRTEIKLVYVMRSYYPLKREQN